MEYSASMVSTLLWWSETQTVAALVQEGKTKEDIVILAKDSNIFHVRSEDRRRRIAGVTYRRIKALPEEMTAYLSRADFRTAQVIVLIAVMLTDRLFKEFCEDVLYDAIRFQTFHITDAAIAAFLREKINQSPKVASFSESAIKKLKQTLPKYLYDGGLLASSTGERRILSPLTAGDFLTVCEACGLGPYYRILTGRNV